MAKKLSNVNIFKFRVIIDTEEDVFTDIEIETDATFEEFHRSVLDAFDFEEGEMASFYMSDESWEKGLEIPLMDMGQSAALSMKSTKLSDMLNKPADKVLYVYDFMRMWIFYVELVEVKKDTPSTIYPRVSLVYGDAPSQDSKELLKILRRWICLERSSRKMSLMRCTVAQMMTRMMKIKCLMRTMSSLMLKILTVPTQIKMIISIKDGIYSK